MWKIIRVIFMLLGVILLGLIGTAAVFFYWDPFDIERVNKATREDVQFIFNSSGLNSDQDFIIEYSFESPRSMLGDHRDVYCLQLSDISVREFYRNKWVLGPEKNPLYFQARERATEFASQTVNSIPCFSEDIDTNSFEVSAFIEYLRIEDRSVSDFSIFLLHRPSKRLLVVDQSS